MTRDTQQNELGTFLKARRAELTPHEVGIAAGAGSRRVAGLRREEVARLASISTDASRSPRPSSAPSPTC